jgi:hypothetical protein
MYGGMPATMAMHDAFHTAKATIMLQPCRKSTATAQSYTSLHLCVRWLRAAALWQRGLRDLIDGPRRSTAGLISRKNVAMHADCRQLSGKQRVQTV